MLDLEPRVHLEEGGLAPVVDEELAGAGAHVADRAGEASGPPSPSRCAEVGIDGRRRRLLEDLLVAALDRAVALAEVDAVAVRIEQDLDLDVATALDEALEDEPVVTEGGRRLAPGGGERVGQAAGLADGAHPLAAAAGRRLDEEREADPRLPPGSGRGRDWSGPS